MTLRRSLALPSMLLGLLACDPVGVDPDAGPPRLELGSGEGMFASFEDGDTLELMPGCQGSQHVWVALQAAGIDPRGPIIDLELVRNADDVVVSQTFRVRVSFDAVPGTGYAEIYGLTLVVPEPEMALGQDLTLRATVTDMHEVSVTDERPIRLEWTTDGPCGPPPG